MIYNYAILMIGAGTSETPCRIRVIHLKVLKLVRLKKKAAVLTSVLIHEADWEIGRGLNRETGVEDLQEQLI